MSLVKWAFIGLLLLPAAEIGTFVLFALTIGWFWTVVLLFATTLSGVVVLKRAGRRHFDRLRSAVARDGIAAVNIDSPAVGAVLGGILLVLPGFITDLLGALLLLPQVRRRLRGSFRRATDARRTQQRPAVIDLTPEEWRQISERAVDDARKYKTLR
jgi:UPF0716 protein FxsA